MSFDAGLGRGNVAQIWRTVLYPTGLTVAELGELDHDTATVSGVVSTAQITRASDAVDEHGEILLESYLAVIKGRNLHTSSWTTASSRTLVDVRSGRAPTGHFKLTAKLPIWGAAVQPTDSVYVALSTRATFWRSQAANPTVCTPLPPFDHPACTGAWTPGLEPDGAEVTGSISSIELD